MKKKYINPTVKVVDIKPRTILCGSITQEGNNLKVTFGSDEFEDGGEIN